MADTDILSLPAEVAFAGSASMAEAAQADAGSVTFTGTGAVSQGAVSVPASMTFSGGTPFIVCDHIVQAIVAEVIFSGGCNRVKYTVIPPDIVVAGGTMSLNTYVYNIFGEIVADGTNDFTSHVYKLALLDTGYTPNIDSDEYWSDVSGDEVAVVSGYVSGGNTLNDILVTRSDLTNITTVSWDPAQWDIPYGAQLTGAKGAVVYNDSLASKPLLAFFEFASAMTVPQENSFVVTPIIQLKNGGV